LLASFLRLQVSGMQRIKPARHVLRFGLMPASRETY